MTSRRPPLPPSAVVAAMRAAASMVGHRSRSGVAHAIARAGARITGAARAAVFVDPEALRAPDLVPAPSVGTPTSLVAVAWWGAAPGERAETDPFALAMAAVARRRTVASGAHRTPTGGGSAGAPSPWPDAPFAIAAPLVAARRVIGALVVGHDRADLSDRDARSILGALAPVAAAALVAAARHEDAVRQAIHDPLTGLLNRAGFDRRLREELDRTHRGATVPGALVLIDLDNFKHVNDTWGHLAGDAVVRIVARDAIRARVRSYDAPCRLGGDEFAVILPHTGLPHAVAVAERIRRAVLAAPTDVAGVPRGTVGASLGVVSFASGGVGPDDLLARADLILYRAKRGGRNVVVADEAG